MSLIHISRPGTLTANLIALAEKLGFNVPLNRQPESESEWPGSFEKYTYYYSL